MKQDQLNSKIFTTVCNINKGLSLCLGPHLAPLASAVHSQSQYECTGKELQLSSNRWEQQYFHGEPDNFPLISYLDTRKLSQLPNLSLVWGNRNTGFKWWQQKTVAFYGKGEWMPKAGFPQGKQSNYFVATKAIPGCFLPISRPLI